MSAPPHDERVMSPDPCFPSPTRIRRGCDGRRAKRGNRAPVRPGASRSSANDRVEAELSAARSWLPLRRHFGTLDLTAPLHEEGQRRRRDPYRRNGAVRARCLAWLLHRRTDSHMPASVIGSILTFLQVGGSHAGRRSAGRRWCCGIRRALERSCSQTAMDTHAFRRRRRRRLRPPPNSRTDRSQWTARAILRPAVV